MLHESNHLPRGLSTCGDFLVFSQNVHNDEFTPYEGHNNWIEGVHMKKKILSKKKTHIQIQHNIKNYYLSKR